MRLSVASQLSAPNSVTYVRLITAPLIDWRGLNVAWRYIIARIMTSDVASKVAPHWGIPESWCRLWVDKVPRASERERDRDRERDRETERQRDRETETERDRDRERKGERDRQTHTDTQRKGNCNLVRNSRLCHPFTLSLFLSLCLCLSISLSLFHTHTYTPTHTPTYTHLYTHIYTHIHTQSDRQTETDRQSAWKRYTTAAEERETIK